MFKKSKINLLMIASLLCSSLISTSCSAFFGDDGYLITSTSSSVSENGDTILTLEFSNSEIKPMTITIPKGISGKDGVGIESITPILNGDKVQITIKYTDRNIEDTVIEYPILHGKDGKEIVDVVVGKDNLDNITLKFAYSDGTESKIITIPKGNDGNGIANINKQPILDTDGKIIGTKLTIEFTSNDEPFVFEVSNGKDGNGISDIVYDLENSTSEFYSLKLIFDDKTEKNILVPVPKSTIWYADSKIPTDNIGKEGDFYLNTVTSEVYQKISSKWIYLFSMKAESVLKESFYIRFDPNGGGFSNGDGTYSKDILRMPVTEYTQIKLNDIEIPHYQGHKFLGWYTSSIYDVNHEGYNPNSGKLTDLTILTKENFANATFYAWWL